MNDTLAKVRVLAFEHIPGIVNGCRRCGVNHHYGFWAIRVKIEGDDTEYFLGFNSGEYPECCGESKSTWIQIFQTKLAAQKVARQAQWLADRDGLSALPVISRHAFMQNAIE
jgi:hypothetical protein